MYVLSTQSEYVPVGPTQWMLKARRRRLVQKFVTNGIYSFIHLFSLFQQVTSPSLFTSSTTYLLSISQDVPLYSVLYSFLLSSLLHPPQHNSHLLLSFWPISLFNYPCFNEHGSSCDTRGKRLVAQNLPIFFGTGGEKKGREKDHGRK